MKFVILFALLFVAASEKPTTTPKPTTDPEADHQWALKVYAQSEEIRQQLLAYQQTHRDKWDKDNNVASKLISAGLDGVLHGLEKAQAWFKDHLIDHPEKMEKLRAKVLEEILKTVRELMSGKKTVADAKKEIEKVQAFYF